jgi:hypothetical protein
MTIGVAEGVQLGLRPADAAAPRLAFHLQRRQRLGLCPWLVQACLHRAKGFGEHDMALPRSADISYKGARSSRTCLPSSDKKPGALEGGYGGVASATVGVGVGANAARRLDSRSRCSPSASKATGERGGRNRCSQTKFDKGLSVRWKSPAKLAGLFQ